MISRLFVFGDFIPDYMIRPTIAAVQPKKQ